jgi:hypothetical protein
MPNKPLLPVLAALAALSSADAAVLWTTAFTGTDETARSLVNTTGDASFTDTLAGMSANLTFSDTTFTAPNFKNVGSRTYFSPNTNVDNPAAASPQNGGSWQTEFRYTGGSQTISLESVVFDMVWTNSTGALQVGDTTVRDITLTGEYSLDGGANWLALAAAQSYNMTVNPGTTTQQHQDRTFTLGSTLTIDNATQDLWIRVKAENSGITAGAYANIRDITFNGTVVPEPTAALLGWLGLLALLRRRR